MTEAYKTKVLSAVIAASCICVFLSGTTICLTQDSGFFQRAFYPLSHTNVFHLAANLTALFYFRPRLKTCAIAFAVSYIVTYIPFAHLPTPTCGLSGFLMACFARYYYAWRKPIWPLFLANAAFIPLRCINWRIHILCFIISYLIYAIIQNPRK